jgi:hypothetical protein
MSGNAGHQRSEDERSDNDLDKPQKDIAEHAQVFGELGPVETNFPADQHGEKNPASEGLASKGGCGDDGEARPAQQGNPKMSSGEQRDRRSYYKESDPENGDGRRSRARFRVWQSFGGNLAHPVLVQQILSSLWPNGFLWRVVFGTLWWMEGLRAEPLEHRGRAALERRVKSLLT